MLETRLLPNDPPSLRLAADALRRGALVAFPTETVYGLGANALDRNAVESIFQAKGRPTNNPLIVHVAELSQLDMVARDYHSTLFGQLTTRFWPGPLTLVLPKHPDLPAAVTAGGHTVAVRMPNHPVALELLKFAGVPIAAPSANRSGELSPTTAEHVRLSLNSRIPWIIDGGPCPGGLESTVVDLTTTPPRMLRSGLITIDQLQDYGRIDDGTSTLQNSAVAASPGMLSRHYAPHTKLECADSPEEADALARTYEFAGLSVGRWQPIGTPREVASRFYAELHTLDQQGFDRIIALRPCYTIEWQAIHDRLNRASA